MLIFEFNSTNLIIIEKEQIMQRALLLSGALFGGFYLTQNKKSECCGIIGILSDKRENIAPSLSMGV